MSFRESCYGELMKFIDIFSASKRNNDELTKRFASRITIGELANIEAQKNVQRIIQSPDETRRQLSLFPAA